MSQGRGQRSIVSLTFTQSSLLSLVASLLMSRTALPYPPGPFKMLCRPINSTPKRLTISPIVRLHRRAVNRIVDVAAAHEPDATRTSEPVTASASGSSAADTRSPAAKPLSSLTTTSSHHQADPTGKTTTPSTKSASLVPVSNILLLWHERSCSNLAGRCWRSRCACRTLRHSLHSCIHYSAQRTHAPTRKPILCAGIPKRTTETRIPQGCRDVDTVGEDD